MSCFSVTAVFRRIPEVTRWLAITGVCVVLARAGEEVGLPAPQLLIGTAAGAVIAAVGKADRAVPGRHARANHALVGVLMGSYLDPAALAGVVGVAFASLAATLVTIVICVLAALLLARVSALSTRDAVLSLAPGGSAAIIASARELGADPWQVALAQSLRIAMVALTAPLLVLVVDPAAQPRTPRGAEDWSWAHAVVLVERPAGVAPLLVLTAVCLLGARLGTRLRLPAPALLGSAVLTVLVVSTSTASGFAPAGLLRDLVLVMAGLEAGLHFSRTRLRTTRLLPHLAVAILVVCAACAGVACVFSAATGVGFIPAYLATTPGGITAVLATTASTGTDMTVVSTAQCVRLVVVAMVVPLVVRGLMHWRVRLAARRSRP